MGAGDGERGRDGQVEGQEKGGGGGGVPSASETLQLEHAAMIAEPAHEGPEWDEVETEDGQK
jgi:hypothetical protein